MLELKLCDGERKNSVVRGFYDAYNNWQDKWHLSEERALIYYLSRNETGKGKIRENGAFEKVLKGTLYLAEKGRPVERFTFADIVLEVIGTLPTRERKRYLKQYPFLKEKMVEE